MGTSDWLVARLRGRAMLRCASVDDGALSARIAGTGLTLRPRADFWASAMEAGPLQHAGTSLTFNKTIDQSSLMKFGAWETRPGFCSAPALMWVTTTAFISWMLE